MILKICLIVCIVTIIGLVTFQFIDPKLNKNNNTTIVEEDHSLKIGISGEVIKPGDYVLKEKATMEDLIAAAGGINTNGDDRCYYLEATVENNCSYYIPPKYDNTDVCSEDPIVKININDGTKEDLLTINGFGETIVSSIISFREENGLFYTIEAIMNVSGIGNAKFNLCKNYIVLHE